MSGYWHEDTPGDESLEAKIDRGAAAVRDRFAKAKDWVLGRAQGKGKGKGKGKS